MSCPLGGQTAGKAPAELGRQGYRIEVSSEGIIVSANTVEGLNNSVFKLFELLRFSSLPELQINDWPNCEHRGVMIESGSGRGIPGLYNLAASFFG